MKYYLIAGEASGDLHASHLMQALKEKDPEAEFRFYGGEMMAAVGGTLVQHYRDLAYMGFIPVLLHLRTILRGMKHCKQDILDWQPDALILIDYPGFNLSIAKYIHLHSSIPVHYYIAPKIWAWKEHRIQRIKRDVDFLYSILPFEVEFFEGKHGYQIDYVGNPSVDEVTAFKQQNAMAPQKNAYSSQKTLSSSQKTEQATQRTEHSSQRTEQPSQKSLHSPQKTERLPQNDRPIIALLPGSRRQEIEDNLSRMLKAVEAFSEQYQVVIAGAPNIEGSFYTQIYERENLRLSNDLNVEVRYGKTYELLSSATAALVTSGTATLETALFGVPQVVCYWMRCGWLVNKVRPYFLKVPFISLVNLIAGKEVVPELVANQMNVENCQQQLADILPGGPSRQAQLEGYALMEQRLGKPGAPQHAASLIIERCERHQ